MKWPKNGVGDLDEKSVPNQVPVVSEVKFDGSPHQPEEAELLPGVLQARAITSIWPRSHVWTIIFLYVCLFRGECVLC